MFHYADVPLSVIDNLINLEEELQVLNRTRKFYGQNKNYLGHRKISDSGMPIDETSDSIQGNTNLDSKDNNGIWLPFYSESMPMYENDENITAFLKASRNGIKQKIKGVRRLKLNKSVEQEGGTETMADFQSI